MKFIEDGIIMETIGPDGLRYLPYLASLFFFILISNLFEVIPGFQMPANARMGGPAFLALVTWAYFIVVGCKHQGPLKYLKNSLFPPGVPGRPATSWSPRSSSSRPSWCGPSPSPSGSSPTCSPVTSCS